MVKSSTNITAVINSFTLKHNRRICKVKSGLPSRSCTVINPQKNRKNSPPWTGIELGPTLMAVQYGTSRPAGHPLVIIHTVSAGGGSL